MLTTLLSPQNAPLNNLTLQRIQLDAKSPIETIETFGHECLLYSLVGYAQLSMDETPIGTIGARSAVSEPEIQAVRFPHVDIGISEFIHVTLQGYAADLLLVIRANDDAPTQATFTPYVHHGDSWRHQVGTGTHQREVRVMETPAGYSIESGETLNIPGGISSWPPHANSEDMAQYANGKTEWNEVMFFIGKAPGIAVLDGYYSNHPRSNRREYTREVYRVENGSAHVMPLGSHVIYAAPDAPLWYFWAYCGTALQKQYRKWATDVGTYRK